jgi:hypothetical protein
MVEMGKRLNKTEKRREKGMKDKENRAGRIRQGRMLGKSG